MKFKIDGSYVNGTDIGHPDGVDIFTACCCGFVAGDTSEKRDANARLIVAAPEMYELLANLAAVCDSWDEDYENDEQRADAFWHMARIAKVLLLTKIEGGENNG